MTWQAVRRAREVLAAEQGTIVKDWGGRLPVALIYPNSYYVGMSSLGFQSLYRLFNDRADIVAERVFWAAQGAPLSLETQQPLADFRVLAVSLSFELDLLHLIELLGRAGLPPLVRERDEDAPLILAGGPTASANPELLAPLVDAVFVGEVESELPRLAETLVLTAGAPRQERCRALASLPGLFVPDEGPRPVQRIWLADLDAHPTHTQVVTADTEFGDMYLIEIARGCPHGCRFCLAGRLYHPMRQRSVSVILAQAREGLRYRPTIGLVAAAVSDYAGIDNLIDGLRSLGARVAVSSLRVDLLSESLLQALAESGTQTLTIAPEAGSERLRRTIAKGIRHEHILAAAERAQAHGFRQLKLYFMVGLPGETDQDVAAIVDLVGEIRAHFRRHITLHVTPFVPKPHTPFAREPMAPEALLKRRTRHLSQELRSHGIALRSEGSAWARVQGVLARGDQRLGEALAQLPAPTLAGWRHMLQKARLDEEDYLRERAAGELLPWDVVGCQ